MDMEKFRSKVGCGKRIVTRSLFSLVPFLPVELLRIDATTRRVTVLLI